MFDENDFDLYAADDAVIEELPEGDALSSYATVMTAGTAGSTASSIGTASTFG